MVRTDMTSKNTGLSGEFQQVFEEFCKPVTRGGTRPICGKNDGEYPKKTPLGAVWGAPAGFKEAIQPPAQHRRLQLPGLRGGKTETAEMPESATPVYESTLSIQTYMNLTYT
jgi:hypothetical protein